ncbi:unnamed protein product [Scytosiphon promiscuus]
MPDLYTLDDGPILAFSPRFEAARFLADVLLLSCNREDPQVKKIQSLKAQRRNPTHVKKRRKPLLEEGMEASIESGAALLVAASLKHLQDDRAMASTVIADEEGTRAGAETTAVGSGGSSGSGGSGEGGQEQPAVPTGFTLDDLHRELQALLGVKVSRAVALEGVRTARGVVRGAHERLWWTFDAEAARSAIGSGGEEGRDEATGVAELGGFLSRAFNLGRSEPGETESARKTARQSQPQPQPPPLLPASSAGPPVPASVSLAPAPKDAKQELVTLSDGVVSVVPAEDS